MTYEELLSQFPGKRKPNGDGGFLVSCPVPGHGKGRGDLDPSLSISPGNGSGPLLNCFAGCDTGAVLASVGRSFPDILPPRDEPRRRKVDARKPALRAAKATENVKHVLQSPVSPIGDKPSHDSHGVITRYPIREAGDVVAIHVREDFTDGREKKVWWEQADGTPGLGGRKLAALPLYGSDRITADAEQVIICEGEKATDACLMNGIAAVGTFGADVIPGDDALRPLMEHTVYLWRDNDEPGRKHMEKIGAALLRLGHSDVRIIDWKGAPPKGDAADLFAFEGARDDFDVLMDEARVFPSTQTESATIPAIGPKVPLFAPLSTLLANQPPQRWLVKGLIESPSIVLVFGPSGAGKSFVAGDLAGATAVNGQWMGRDVSGGPTFYVAGEGRLGLIRRFRAWQLKHKATIPDNRLFLSVVRIEMNASGAAEVEQEVERRTQEIGEKPALIVIDTLARALPAGDDENNAKDMMAFVNNADRIRDRFGCVVVIVHHSGVADDKRARGSTSLKAAMDAELCITKRGAIRTAEWTKLKDLPDEPRPQEFALESELLGQDDDGNLITSAVVAWKGRTTLKTNVTTTKAEDLGLDTLRAALAGGDSATLTAWRTMFYAKHWGDSEAAKQKAFQRVRGALVGKKLIRIDGGDYSIPSNQHHRE